MAKKYLRGLSPKQTLFVQWYLVYDCPERAAQMAGYRGGRDAGRKVIECSLGVQRAIEEARKAKSRP